MIKAEFAQSSTVSKIIGLVAGLLIMVALSGCQSFGGPPDNLTITYDDGSGNQQEWTLACDPPSGSHPDPEGACKALEDNGDEALPATPDTTPCTQQYGGPQQATITGTWHGDQVDSTVTRGNGCEINRWDLLEPLLPKPS